MAPTSHPLISVIIPTYGRPLALRQCMVSLARQQYPREMFEVLVIDDGGDPPAALSRPNEASDICVTVLRQSNQGASAARNAGMAAARGKILAFLDDDCTVPPDYLSSIEQVFTSRPETMVVQVALDNPEPNNIYGQAWKFALEQTLAINLHPDANGRFTCGIVGGVMVARREVFGVVAYDPGLKRRHDADLRYQLQTLNVAVYYEPQIRVFHHYRQTFRAYLSTFFGYGRAELHLQQKWTGTPSPFHYPNLTSPQALRSLYRTEGLIRGIQIYCLLWLKRHAGRWGVLYEKTARTSPNHRVLRWVRFGSLVLATYAPRRFWSIT